MPSGSRTSESLLARIEGEERLDAPAGAGASLLSKLLRPGKIKDLLSGTPLGHAAHPALVVVPIGSWLTASVLDLTGADADAARRAVGLGIVSALPASLTGASDWVDTEGAERRVGLVHAAGNYVALGLQLASWTARRRGARSSGAALTLAANVLAGGTAWLGGHLAYAMGVGVDTTAFQQLPTEWTDAIAELDVPEVGLASADVAGVPVLFGRVRGRIVALADRCTHRGAPLHEGTLRGDCVVCPWHDSVFDLVDGSVDQGPATRPQPVFDVDVSGGRVLVRRSEPRTLRTNPAGA